MNGVTIVWQRGADQNHDAIARIVLDRGAELRHGGAQKNFEKLEKLIKKNGR